MLCCHDDSDDFFQFIIHCWRGAPPTHTHARCLSAQLVSSLGLAIDKGLQDNITAIVDECFFGVRLLTGSRATERRDGGGEAASVLDGADAGVSMVERCAVVLAVAVGERG
jgi:hypothetical protein